MRPTNLTKTVFATTLSLALLGGGCGGVAGTGTDDDPEARAPDPNSERKAQFLFLPAAFWWGAGLTAGGIDIYQHGWNGSTTGTFFNGVGNTIGTTATTAWGNMGGPGWWNNTFTPSWNSTVPDLFRIGQNFNAAQLAFPGSGPADGKRLRPDADGRYTFSVACQITLAGGTKGRDGDCDGIDDVRDTCSATWGRPPELAANKLWVHQAGIFAGCSEGQIRDVGDTDRDSIGDSVDTCPQTTVHTVIAANGQFQGCSVRQRPEVMHFFHEMYKRAAPAAAAANVTTPGMAVK